MFLEYSPEARKAGAHSSSDILCGRWRYSLMRERGRPNSPIPAYSITRNDPMNATWHGDIGPD